MKAEQIEKRIRNEAIYYLTNKSTIRDTAKEFGVSKSTTHKDLAQRLKYLNYELYTEVNKLINANIEDRHNRGGEATKLKYKGV